MSHDQKDKPIYRVYAGTKDSFQSLLAWTEWKKLQVVLAFARDYDKKGAHTGDFQPHFDVANIKKTEIPQMKNLARAADRESPVKFFLSIGGRNKNYRFSVKKDKKADWVKKATKSLKTIIKDYGFDGIDVYYQHIEEGDQFVDAMGDVIDKLKKDRDLPADFQVSITVSEQCEGYYESLFKKHQNNIDTVVYQTHSLGKPVASVRDLQGALQGHPYPRDKLLAGHSITPADWSNVPLPVFLGALPKFIDNKPDSVAGVSTWIVTDGFNPEK